MTQYLLRRLLLTIPTLFLVSVMAFLIVRLIPGDAVTLMFADLGYAKSIEQMRARLGLDLPFYEQYARWIGDLLHGRFGESLWTQRTVLSQLGERLPVTLELSCLSLAFAVLYGGVTGVIAAVRHDDWMDMSLRSVAMAFLSLPSFWLGTLAIVLPSLYIGWSPSIRLVPFTADPLGSLGQFLLPAVCLGITQAGVIMRMTRGMMLEVLRQDYVRTAWSKGLASRAVVLRHALRNAMIPIVTVIGGQMPFYFGGSIVMEHIFGLPGMGSFVLEAINRRDYPVLQAVNLFLALLVILSNLLVDLSYGVLDPRVRQHS